MNNKNTTVSVIGKYQYPEALELLYYWAFKQTGVKTKHHPSKEADLTLCIKTPPPNKTNPEGHTALYMPDNAERYSFTQDLTNQFEHVLTMHNDIPNSKQINPAYCSNLHKTPDQPPARQIDKPVFIGTAHDCRQWMADLENIDIFGNGWEKYGINTSPRYRENKANEYVKHLAIINQTYPGDYCNMRFYEALRIGKQTPLITDKWPLNEDWTPWKHFIPYDGTKQHLQDTLDELDSYKTEKIAEYGYEKVKGYTYQKRAEEILNHFNLPHS